MKAVIIVESSNESIAGTWAVPVNSVEEGKEWFQHNLPAITEYTKHPDVKYVSTMVLDFDQQVKFYKEYQKLV